MLGFVTNGVHEVQKDSLCALERDAVSTVREIHGPERFLDRLKSVGIVVGSHIKVLRTGCPVVVHTEGGRFCLRKEDASQIRVDPNPAEALA
ncbi:TPA: hypothetical protein DCE37_25885 [Candidatus Latescibacteria bacterium]|nr:hypothetical protein [Candidatus Latescibacterota bacterium]